MGSHLPNTKPLLMEGDLAMQMVEGIRKFLMRETDASIERRQRHWNRDFSSHENYVKSVEPNRKRFQKIIGVVDQREPVEMHLVCTTSQPALVGEGDGFKVYAVRWNVLKGVDGEGLLIEPEGKPIANVIALPDCEWTPEMLVGLTKGLPKQAQFARKLAENRCRVVVPVLISRQQTYLSTDISLRELIYRAAFELGRHIIGYEVQKVLAVVDWFVGEDEKSKRVSKRKPIGVIGYGEGGLIAFYAAAIDTRIDVVAVSGYFQPRERLYQEPIYRNVFGLLDEFGDAEILSLIAPRSVVIEACKHPEVEGRPEGGQGRAAPGFLTTPPFEAVEKEFERAKRLIEDLKPQPFIRLIKSRNGLVGSEEMIEAFLKALGAEVKVAPHAKSPKHQRKFFDPCQRLKTQFEQLLEHTQYLMRESELRRAEFWSKADATNLKTWKESCRWYRDYFWDEVIGRLPPATLPANPRTRLIYDEPKFKGYEVVLDVYPDVFAYGILLVPKGIKRGERRPVVVCQHGLESRAQDVTDPKVSHPTLHQFGCKLAERGFVVYAPQNPYIGGDKFRTLQKMANLLKKTLFSIIVRQHERTLEWLSSLPFVDPERIGFYGLSYGGHTAMRVPALLEQYCLSICSANFNEWVWKTVSVRHEYSFLALGEYEMFEFDLANTFNYAEMSWLICPRPFMVERGHFDGVAPDEWVAYEYAKTKRRYDLLGLGERTEMEVFNGGHEINGVGTFEFLHKHLNWPKPKEKG